MGMAGLFPQGVQYPTGSPQQGVHYPQQGVQTLSGPPQGVHLVPGTLQPPVQFTTGVQQQQGGSFPGSVHLGQSPSMPFHPSQLFASGSQGSGQATLLPNAFNTTTLQEPASGNWNMDTGASSHLNDSVHCLSDILNMCIYPSVAVGDGHFIPVTNSGHSVLSTPFHPLRLNNVLITPNIVKNLISVRQFVRDNSCTVEFDPFGFSVKDFITRRVLLRCDSTVGFVDLSNSESFSVPALIFCFLEQYHKHAPLPLMIHHRVPIHPMDPKRSRVGTTRPNPRYAGHVSTISPLPRSYKEAFNDPNWQNAITTLFGLSRHLAPGVQRFAAYITNVDLLLVVRCATGWICNPSLTLIDTGFHVGDGGTPVCLYMHESTRALISCSSKRIWAYVQGLWTMVLTANFHLLLLHDSNFSYTDWLVARQTRLSILRYCVFLGNNLLSWSSKRQPTLSRSSAEAEYHGVANAVAETCRIRNLLLYISWYQEPKFLIKMLPRKNRTLYEIHEQELEDHVMERMEERFDQFVDQLSDQMDQLMNRHGRRPRRNQREDNRHWESRMRVNILDFDGDTLSPEGFIDWLVTVEEVFEFKEVPENKRVSLIATKLRGRASAWWQQLKLTRERMYQWLQNLKQGSKSVEDYTTKFYQLIARNDIQETEYQLRALAFEEQNSRVGSLSSPAITSASGLGNVVSRFAPSQAKAGGGNTGPVSRVSSSSGLNCFNYGEPSKVCIFVCDSGSCDNLIATEVVQKLGLKTENHPKPYKLQWLKKGSECDVVPMDARHLLLRRPWEYDHDITHNGRTNTYSILFGGVKITLMPNKPKEVVSKPTGTLLTLSQFKDELEMGNDVFVLIRKEVAEDSEIPEAIIPLLEEFLDVFPDELLDGLPPLRDIQNHIDLEPGSRLPIRPHYKISLREHEELRRQKDDTWRMCIDIRAINKITLRYRFPIPCLDDLLDHISGATIFTKLNLKSGHYQIHLRPGNEWKTGFKTREGLYEWLVMPFGLSNAPSAFVHVMNQLFRPYIGKFVVVYFDDILIYSASFNVHVTHVRQVLTLLRKDSFYVATKKCVFMIHDVYFPKL
ncbi:putative nucleotidyltransferase, ribonuclease H [Tanacetum coccineum]